MDLDVLSRTVNVSWSGPLTAANHSVLYKIFLARLGPTAFAVDFDAWQPMPGNRARVTLPVGSTQHFIDTVSGRSYSGHRVTVTRERYVRTIVIKYLPIALSVDALSEALSKYGTVLSHKSCQSLGVSNGTREVEMDLMSHLPSCVSILGYRGLVSYLHQPRTCFACHSLGHLRENCPDRVKSTVPTSTQSASATPVVAAVSVPVSITSPMESATSVAVVSAPIKYPSESVAVSVPVSITSPSESVTSVAAVSVPIKSPSASATPAVAAVSVPIADPTPEPVLQSPVTIPPYPDEPKPSREAVMRCVARMTGKPVSLLPATKPAIPPLGESYSERLKDSIPAPPRDLDDEWATEEWLSRQAESPEPPEYLPFGDDSPPPHRKHHRKKHSKRHERSNCIAPT